MLCYCCYRLFLRHVELFQRFGIFLIQPERFASAGCVRIAGQKGQRVAMRGFGRVLEYDGTRYGRPITTLAQYDAFELGLLLVRDVSSDGRVLHDLVDDALEIMRFRIEYYGA